tara:strand:- start:652 stop:1089 length:438 start_codon:yes stop_codon:yes gene_type:complete
MYDDKECIICLTDTSANDYLQLDCCKKTVHINCLNIWIKTNINNNEVKKCFYCKENNDYINTIIYYTRLEERNNTNYDSDNNSLIEVQNNNPIINIRQPRSCMILINFLCFIIMITTVTIFIISDENNPHNNRILLSKLFNSTKN